MHFEVYRDGKGEYRWRARAANGRVIADSGEGYRNLVDAEWALGVLREDAPDAEIHYAEGVKERA
jgi:uncharacterized protein YegP (UPF0339 family)